MTKALLTALLWATIEFCNGQTMRFNLIGNHLQEHTEKLIYNDNGLLYTFGVGLGNIPFSRSLNICVNENLDSINMMLSDSIYDNVSIWGGMCYK